jgi:ammonia channel protein AmtB
VKDTQCLSSGGPSWDFKLEIFFFKLKMATTNFSTFSESDLLLERAISVIFVLFTAMNILMMQVGFLALEAGASRAKSTKTLLYKNFIDIGVCALCFYSVGWGLYKGDNGFAAGDGATFYIHPVNEYANLFQLYSFAVVVATIVSSSVNPRMRIES